MRTTRYFDEQVVRKRPYINAELCAAALVRPIRRQTQADGRIRVWSRVQDVRNGRSRILRVVLLTDGLTLHNAFFDRGFNEDEP